MAERAVLLVNLRALFKGVFTRREWRLFDLAADPRAKRNVHDLSLVREGVIVHRYRRMPVSQVEVPARDDDCAREYDPENEDKEAV